MSTAGRKTKKAVGNNGSQTIVYLKPSQIKPYHNNPRVNDNAVIKVAESIQAFGFRNPIIVDKDKVIIAGHTRWKAALKLELDKVPVIIAKDLTPEQAKAYRIADNRLAEFAEWDFEALEIELKDVSNELKNLFDFKLDDFIVSAGDGEKELDENIETGYECPKCGYKWN